jgi:hypothetical protein
LIDIVNFQSFNRYNADVMGCTTFSFAINFSIYLSDVASDYPLATRDGHLRPAEYEGHIRRRVSPVHPYLEKTPDIWFVDQEGRSTETVVAQAALTVTDTADSWFVAFPDRRTVLAILRDLSSPPDESTWLPGAPRSAARNMAVGYLALALGDRATAASHLREALEQCRGFDAKNATISKRIEKGTPAHLERAVATLATESALGGQSV